MARREARSALVRLRVTDAEKVAIEAAAKAAGVSLSDYARRLLLAVPAAAERERNPAVLYSATEAAQMQADATGMPTTPVSDLRRSEFRCPLAPARCSFVAGSERARCPVHGRTVVVA